jgi:hypothetical protein
VLRHLCHRPRRIFRLEEGACRGRGPVGEGGARRGLRHDGRVRRVEGEKREAESCWKSGGGRTRLYTWLRVGVADEAGSDTIPNAAGGEGGHGAARPHPVIHRYVFYHSNFR